jgi:hypothetical protein
MSIFVEYYRNAISVIVKYYRDAIRMKKGSWNAIRLLRNISLAYYNCKVRQFGIKIHR